MKTLALKIKELALKLLDILILAAYPSTNQKADNWWNYIDY